MERSYTVRRGDLDLQGDYDNAPSDFDRVYYRALQILLITNYATLVLTCTVHVHLILPYHSSIIHPIKVRRGIIIVTLKI